MGLPDLAAFEEAGQARGTLTLAGMRAGVMNARVKCAGGAAQRVEGQAANDIGGIRQALCGFPFQAADGQHGLGAVDQAEAFLGMKLDRGHTRTYQSLPAAQDRASELGFAFPNQHQRHMREWRQIAAGADASFTRDEGRYAAIEELAETLRHQRPDPGKTLG